MKTLVLSILIVISASFASLLYGQNSLTVKVTDLENSKGTLMVALYNSHDNFLSPYAEGKAVKVEGKSGTVVYNNLSDGEYAIALFQDVNDNFTLDMDENMIPTEKYGFSNNVDPAVIKMLPSFLACKFILDTDKTIDIKAVSAKK